MFAIDKELKLKLNSAFNESKINYIDVKSNVVEVLLECISMNAKNEFPDDNRHKFIFKDFGRIAVSYKNGEWDDDNAEVITIETNKLKSKFEGLHLDSMYGWEFINLDAKIFEEWKNNLSLDIIKDEKWSLMNTIDLFAEQIGSQPVTIDVRIWFNNFQIYDYFDNELTKDEFVANAKRGWDQLYKTGIYTENHKIKKL